MRTQTISATSYLTTGHIPTAGEASNGGKDCWQWVKVTDRSHFTSTAIPNHRAPVLFTNTFSFTLVSSPWFPLPSSPHLNPPPPISLLLLPRNLDPSHNKVGPRHTLEKNSFLQQQCANVHECSNTKTPGAMFYWSFTINVFYFFCVSKAVLGRRIRG